MKIGEWRMNNLHQVFQQYYERFNKALDLGKKLGGTISCPEGMDVLIACVVHFLGVVSSAEELISEKESTFCSEVLGIIVTRDDLLEAAQNESLKMPVFHLMQFYDVYLKLFDRHIGSLPTEDYFHFYELLGNEYLNRFRTQKRIDKYNQYMQSILSEIIAEYKNGKIKLCFTPYQMNKAVQSEQTNVPKKTEIPTNLDINRYLHNSNGDFRNIISTLKQFYIQCLDLIEQAVSIVNGISPGKMTIPPSDLLRTSTLFFLGQLVVVDDKINEDEITFIMGVLGCPVNREIVELCVKKLILKTYMFDFLCAFDNLAKKMNVQSQKLCAARVLFDYYKACGCAYLKFFPYPLGRIRAYDQYMNDIAELINKEDQALEEPISIEPYSSPVVDLIEDIRDKLLLRNVEVAQMTELEQQRLQVPVHSVQHQRNSDVSSQLSYEKSINDSNFPQAFEPVNLEKDRA